MRICPACDARFESQEWLCPRCGWVAAVREGFPCLAPELTCGDGTDADYRWEVLAAAEPWHFWFRARQRLLVWAVGRLTSGEGRFLEVGCGTGFVLRRLGEAYPALELWGTELLTMGLSYARRLIPKANLVQMDARRIAFQDHFDAIGAFDVLEHVTEDEIVLSRLRCAVRPGGGVVLTVPQHPRLWSAVDDFSRHKRRYTRRALSAKLERAGLVVRKTTSFSSFLLPLLLVSRFRARKSFDPEREFRLGRSLNGLFDGLSRIETALIRAGVSLPLGSSLLLLATRPDE